MIAFTMLLIVIFYCIALYESQIVLPSKKYNFYYFMRNKFRNY
jgi:hypothetical protein